MNVISIISIVFIILICLFLGKIIFPKNRHAITLFNPKTSLIEEKYKKQLEEAKQNVINSEQKVKDLEVKFKELLDEANRKIKELDEQLALAVEGKDDELIKRKILEVNTLKKKIKVLEEENEDLEDDLDSCNKKLKNKEQDLDKLQIDFDNLLREKRRLQDDLNSISEELDARIRELALKKDSLAFVQEILSAKKVSDDSINDIYAKVDNIYEFIRNEVKETVLHLYKLNAETIDNLFGSGLESWAIIAKKSWIQGKTSIAFVGEFSAGKTSIVNRILSQHNPDVPLFPVSTKATTAIPTYISGGVGTMYQFVAPNNEIKNISEATFKRVDKDVLEQVQGVSSLIQYFVMTYKNPNLDNLSILDTPGFNSNDKEDAERTIGVINECDALFWVFDVNAGTVNRASIELIKQHLKKPLYIVINKVDTKAKSEVDKVEELIRKTLSDAGQNVEGFIRFSSNIPLKDIMTPIKSICHDTNKENYIETLVSSLKEWTSEYESKVIKAKKSADALLNKCISIDEQYNMAIDKMSGDCEDVVKIPQYNPQHGFFNMKAPNYEMSSKDYKRMKNLLQNIRKTHLSSLYGLYNEMSKTAGELENAWKRQSEKREQWQRLNKCLKILNNRIKNLRKN